MIVPETPSRTHHGQLYLQTGSEPHIRQDGTRTSLLRWLSWCAHCGEPFSFTTPANALKFNPNRRCAKHKRPGQRVRK